MDNKSERSDSTTLSDFVRLRMSGDQPVFGGSPVNGMRDLSAAMRGSAPQALLSAANNLANVARDMAINAPAYSLRMPRLGSSSGEASPISLADKSAAVTGSASDLDDEKIKMLLASSSIETSDIRRYLTLLKVARDGMKKKEIAVRMHEQAKAAKVSLIPLVGDDILISDIPANATRLKEVKALCRIELNSTYDVLLLRALTHDSFYGGRESNRLLAYIGDAAAKLYASSAMMEVGHSVADVSAHMSSIQSNTHMRDMAVSLDIHTKSRVASGVDCTARSIAATLYEAIIGVVFLADGMDGLHVLNDTFKFYDP